MFDLSRLHICFIAGTLGQGGAERQLFYILNTLRQLCPRVTLLSMTCGEFWEDRIRSCGVSVKWVGRRSSQLGRMLQIISELRRDPPDVIQSQHFYTNLYAVAAARVLSRREIGALRSDTLSEVQSQSLTGGPSLRAPRKIAANSRAAIQNAITLGIPAERLHLLPNVVDSELFYPSSNKAGRAVKLLAAGRLSAEKRFERFISLVSRVRERSPAEVTGIIVGDGPEQGRLRRLASEIGLGPDAIEFKGEVTEIDQVYRDSDILILTSEFEGTPNVVLEAMSSGLPVVATRVGGVPEIIENNVMGFLIEPYHESKMAEVILRLINEPELRCRSGRAARRHIESNHALDRLPQLLTDLYKAILI